MWSKQYPVPLLRVKHRAEGGHEVKSAEEGKERNTRVGIVGILAAQPVLLPVICFVVNVNSRGEMTDRAGHKSRLSTHRLRLGGLCWDWASTLVS